MKQTLQDVGFQVVYRENTANRRQIKEAVREFTQQLQSGDVGVFYYAGHAVQVKGMLKKVRDGVWDETDGRQVPWENSSLRGDFCFAGCVTEAQRASERERIRFKQEQNRLQRETFGSAIT
jgi:uncharacterized caspase-like protein